MTTVTIEALVREMRRVADRAAQLGGSNPDVTAVAEAVAAIGRLTAEIGERVGMAESRLPLRGE